MADGGKVVVIAGTEALGAARCARLPGEASAGGAHRRGALRSTAEQSLGSSPTPLTPLEPFVALRHGE